ncbi:hypothetical protein Ahy_A08g038374 [Arachis hypogaea]|uniref:Uncharacterized protein n=1 Tax=Arachis hypogaea TaxID=3818 RepID=A0A445BTL1_ARAHY|nr:hypothetical protein Ahy_A08g038374 [Arachis hypogaea]
MEERLKFDDGKKDMKVDSDPFDASVNFAEPFLGVNMVSFSYKFNTTLADFEANVRAVYPGIGEGLLEFFMQQKLKDRDVFLCPRCNTVFNADVAAIFEKERMKKELVHKEEQIRQKQLSRRKEGQSSGVPQRKFSFLNESFTSFWCAMDTKLSKVL